MTDSSQQQHHQQQQQQQQQQFCLRWNNFQANITSQFEALRDDEDFVDVTFACDGRRLQAHKVVLSACSPYFKELFKTNPCNHPIIFMRDVEFEHLQSLLEFMYAGEVNISQAELPTFLRTAESLQIRGLTDSQSSNQHNEKHLRANNISAPNGRGPVSPNFDDEHSKTPSLSPPPLKRLCKRSDSPQISSPAPAVPPCATSTPRPRPLIEPQVELDCYKDVDYMQPKVELPEYGSDEESKHDLNTLPGGFLSLDGGMEVLPSYPSTYAGSGMDGGMPGPSHGNTELNPEQQAASRRVRRGRPRLGIRGGRQQQPTTHGNSPSRGDWLPLDMRTTPPAMPGYRGFDDAVSADGVVHLGEGVAVCEEQLRAVKWSDYRKLTRGLAAILFSPTELATCSVTGQRWSRAGTATERPVKPALDKAKVQAIISYVTSRFPSVDVSSVKQVLAYKCKENSTALKMKSIRYICDRQDTETSPKTEAEDK
ncbi:broad-complex core protein isoforms 1/2/3/4/5-like isoform X4 [Copidosoma floridanum]|uniref:broad-complex core protein isoforms 1/2/3/4/5-like isoform X4 n=1 Tax=Copidosoma floridanum TaxID=29053 RepID=UPI000C6F95C1|nr:broad-complex core protein isoforms 1/2/3/4/5-like isoform X4 [Copidosoma floridanum]